MKSLTLSFNVTLDGDRFQAKTVLVVLYCLYFLQNTSDCGEVFDGGVASVHPDYLTAWVEFLSGHARSPQLLDREHPVVTGLEQVGTILHRRVCYIKLYEGSIVIRRGQVFVSKYVV